MTVWPPDADGSRPVVSAIPGSSGDAELSFAVLAPELARQGLVVIGTDYRTYAKDPATQDVECGYRYAHRIAEEHGGDLSAPVTMLGYSMGGVVALAHGLNDDFATDASAQPTCDGPVQRPDTVVSPAGCHETLQLQDERASLTTTDTAVVMIYGGDDPVCPPQEPPLGGDLLEPAGFTVAMHEIPDANHGELTFHESNDNWVELPADDLPGQHVAYTIVDAALQQT